MKYFLDDHPQDWENPEYEELRNLLVDCAGSDGMTFLKNLADSAGITSGTFPERTNDLRTTCTALIKEMGRQGKLRDLVEKAAEEPTRYTEQFAKMLEQPARPSAGGNLKAGNPFRGLEFKVRRYWWVGGIALLAVLLGITVLSGLFTQKPPLETGVLTFTSVTQPANPPPTETVSPNKPTRAPAFDLESPTPTSQPPHKTPVPPVLPQSDSWQPIVDLPRYINDFAADPSNPAVFYAASGDYANSGSGIYKSQDAGLTWQPVTSGLPNKAVHSLALSQTQPPILFAAVGYDLYASLDGGSSWTLRGSPALNPGFEAQHLLVSPDGTVLFAVGKGDGLMRSRDSGVSWLPLAEGLPLQGSGEANVLSLAIDPQNELILYAGTGGFVGQGQGVFKSLDGGDTWTPANKGMLDYRITALAINPSDSQVVFAGSDSGNLFLSKDGGASWRDLTSSLQLTQYSNPRQIRTIDINPDNPQEIYLLGDNSGVLVSEDGGQVWKLFARPADWDQPMFAAFHVVFGPQAVLEPHPILLAATSGVTIARGWRYGKAQASPESSAQETPAQQTALPTAIAHFSGSWQVVKDLPRGVNSFAVDPSNPQIIFASSGQHGGGGASFKSQDGGLSWSALPAPPADAFNALAFSSSTPSTLYAVTSNTGQVFSSQNGGQTFTPLGKTELGIGFSRQLIPSPGNPSTLFSIADGDGLSRSTDGGISWMLLTGGLPHDKNYVFTMSLAVDPLKPSILYSGTGGFVGSGFGVYKSTNGGETWSPSNRGMLDYRITALAINSLPPQVIYAGSDSGNLFKSTDSGQTWTDLTQNLQITQHNNPRQVRAILIDPTDPQLIYLLADNSALLYSTNGGEKWKPLARPADWDQPMFSAFTVIFGPQPIFLVSLDDGETWRFSS